MPISSELGPRGRPLLLSSHFRIIAFPISVPQYLNTLGGVLAVTSSVLQNESKVPFGLEVQNRGTYVEAPLSYSHCRGFCGKRGLCRSD